MAVKEGVLDYVPKGWVKMEGAQTATLGYSWYCNGKSCFGGEFECALVKDQRDSDEGV